MSKWIDFKEIEAKPKTKVWGVLTKDGDMIGRIFWYAPWRQYCFETEPGTVWAKSCLQDVISFIEEQMEART